MKHEPIKPKAKRKPKAKKKSKVIKQVMWGIYDLAAEKLITLPCSSIPELYAYKSSAENEIRYEYDGIDGSNFIAIKLVLTIKK